MHRFARAQSARCCSGPSPNSNVIVLDVVLFPRCFWKAFSTQGFWEVLKGRLVSSGTHHGNGDAAFALSDSPCTVPTPPPIAGSGWCLWQGKEQLTFPLIKGNRHCRVKSMKTALWACTLPHRGEGQTEPPMGARGCVAPGLRGGQHLLQRAATLWCPGHPRRLQFRGRWSAQAPFLCVRLHGGSERLMLRLRLCRWTGLRCLTSRLQ